MPAPTTDILAAAPPRYTPFASGRYEVGPGLFQLGRQPAYGHLEDRVFVLASDYPGLLEAKLRARAQLERHYLTANLHPALRAAALTFVAARAAAEYPQVFAWDGQSLENRLLGWRGRLDPSGGALLELTRFAAPLAHLVQGLEPHDATDFLACNLPEDLVLLSRDAATGRDWLSMLHVLLPQRWDPREKIGRPFGPVHRPVAGAAPMIRAADRLMSAAVEKGPFVRFAWGLSPDPAPGQHPDDPAPDPTPAAQDPARHVWLRVERQILWGFPEHGGALFTIRPLLEPLGEVARDPQRRRLLAAALRSMSPEARAYKSVEPYLEATLLYLEG
ncbi:hypothetical protein HNR42_002838 [Deinobacterium chartae]|uniref:DUF3445 domain-containing protein n=1 Tax=Deinobacterium chartae TaxID=521158 RepID=A0A841I141_9DEIO|nr:heme-dependent oxidative N-demethylase subunit alpha family protein [Deinobacterium chartae]MBB6099397.1 hypothetical protein [Deinobacterium chartae]